MEICVLQGNFDTFIENERFDSRKSGCVICKKLLISIFWIEMTSSLRIVWTELWRRLMFYSHFLGQNHCFLRLNLLTSQKDIVMVTVTAKFSLEHFYYAEFFKRTSFIVLNQTPEISCHTQLIELFLRLFDFLSAYICKLLILLIRKLYISTINWNNLL